MKVLLILLIALSCCYLYLDRELFYYGKSNFTFYNGLPMGIKPKLTHDFEYGFILNDEHGFVIVSENNSRHSYLSSPNKTIQIDEVLKYGFDNERLIVLIKDINGHKYYVDCFKGPNYSKNNESFINILRDEEFIDEKNLKWIELVKNKKDVERKESFRNFIEFTSVIIIIIIYVKFRRKKLKV